MSSSPVLPSLDGDLLESARRALLEDHALQVGGNDRSPNVDRLLAWMDAGYYGRCSVCSRQIEASRLESDPTISVCGDCIKHRSAPGVLL